MWSRHDGHRVPFCCCCSSVHAGLQATMDQLGWPYRKLEARGLYLPSSMLEKPIRATTVWLYLVGILDLVNELRMAEIPNECPCLVGPDHISKWAVVLDFPRAQHRIGQREGNVIPASSVCVCVLIRLSIGGCRWP